MIMIHGELLREPKDHITKKDFIFLCDMLTISPGIALENSKIVNCLKNRSGWDALELILTNEF